MITWSKLVARRSLFLTLSLLFVSCYSCFSSYFSWSADSQLQECERRLLAEPTSIVAQEDLFKQILRTGNPVEHPSFFPLLFQLQVKSSVVSAEELREIRTHFESLNLQFYTTMKFTANNSLQYSSQLTKAVELSEDLKLNLFDLNKRKHKTAQLKFGVRGTPLEYPLTTNNIGNDQIAHSIADTAPVYAVANLWVPEDFDIAFFNTNTGDLMFSGDVPIQGQILDIALSPNGKYLAAHLKNVFMINDKPVLDGDNNKIVIFKVLANNLKIFRILSGSQYNNFNKLDSSEFRFKSDTVFAFSGPNPRQSLMHWQFRNSKKAPELDINKAYDYRTFPEKDGYICRKHATSPNGKFSFSIYASLKEKPSTIYSFFLDGEDKKEVFYTAGPFARTDPQTFSCNIDDNGAVSIRSLSGYHQTDPNQQHTWYYLTPKFKMALPVKLSK